MSVKTVSALIALSLLLAGCGNKGPLVLPTAPMNDELPAMPEGTDAPAPNDADDADDAEAEAIGPEGLDTPPVPRAR